MKYLSNAFMLDMLSKVQPYQGKVLATGRSAHIDGHYHDHHLFGTPTIDFDFTVFEENAIVKAFDFSASETQEQVEAIFACLVAYVNAL